jgi:hypothetical protein
MTSDNQVTLLEKVWERGSLNYPAYSMKAGHAVSAFPYFDPSVQRALLDVSQQIGHLVERFELAQEIVATEKATTLRSAIHPAIHARVALEHAVALKFPQLVRPGMPVVAAEGTEDLTSESLPTMTPEMRLAERIASRIKYSADPISIIALEFRPEFESLKLIRAESLDGTMVRRFQDFLSTYVYGTLIPEAELRLRVRSGKRTGGRPRGG